MPETCLDCVFTENHFEFGYLREMSSVIGKSECPETINFCVDGGG